LQQEYRRIKKKNKEEEKGEGEEIYICGYIWLMDITYNHQNLWMWIFIGDLTTNGFLCGSKPWIPRCLRIGIPMH
jgi:hypothetical protein